jgi:hypothetical protein
MLPAAPESGSRSKFRRGSQGFSSALAFPVIEVQNHHRALCCFSASMLRRYPRDARMTVAHRHLHEIERGNRHYVREDLLLSRCTRAAADLALEAGAA